MDIEYITSLFYGTTPARLKYPLFVNGRVLCDEKMNMVFFKRPGFLGSQSVNVAAPDWIVSLDFLKQMELEKGLELCDDKENIAETIVMLLSDIRMHNFGPIHQWLCDFLREVHVRFSHIKTGQWQHDCLQLAARRDDFVTAQLVLDMGAQIEWLPGKLRFYTGIACRADNNMVYRWLCAIEDTPVKPEQCFCVEWNNFPEKACVYTVATLAGQKMFCLDYASALFLKEKLGAETTLVISHPEHAEEIILRDPNYIDKECYHEDYSVLAYAIETTNVNLLHLLIRNNADVDALVENIPLIFYTPQQEEHYNQLDKKTGAAGKYSFLFLENTASISKKAIVKIIEKSLKNNKSKLLGA